MATVSGTVALVTGGARRIGRAIALALAERGSDIVVHYNSGKDEATETVAALRSSGGSAESLHADLSHANR
jgi:3-oxoacyl-[acyl-carrier protein] reductase